MNDTTRKCPPWCITDHAADPVRAHTGASAAQATEESDG